MFGASISVALLIIAAVAFQLDAPVALRRQIFGCVSHFTNLTFLLVPEITPHPGLERASSQAPV